MRSRCTAGSAARSLLNLAGSTVLPTRMRTDQTDSFETMLKLDAQAATPAEVADPACGPGLGRTPPPGRARGRYRMLEPIQSAPGGRRRRQPIRADQAPPHKVHRGRSRLRWAWRTPAFLGQPDNPNGRWRPPVAHASPLPRPSPPSSPGRPQRGWQAPQYLWKSQTRCRGLWRDGGQKKNPAAPTTGFSLSQEKRGLLGQRQPVDHHPDDCPAEQS